MFSERLEKLIQSSLQDGILTDQEKAAIIKRAKAEGEDIDEVEIYIDSLVSIYFCIIGVNSAMIFSCSVKGSTTKRTRKSLRIRIYLSTKY